jgi:hypothetical protein
MDCIKQVIHRFRDKYNELKKNEKEGEDQKCELRKNPAQLKKLPAPPRAVK